MKQNLTLSDLGKMIQEVYRVFKKRTEMPQYEEIKVSVEQFGLLHAISNMDEDVIQKDMAEMMGKDKSTILRMIDLLEEKELIRRVSDTKDRRKNYLMVTKLGHKVLEQYMKIIKGLMEDIQQGLTQTEIDTFLRVVKHIRKRAKEV